MCRWPCRQWGPGSIATRLPIKQRPLPPSAEGSALARYYDLDVADERADISLYLALASATDGPVLELACGTGRLAIPLATAGHDVTGVDLDAAMVDRARAAWAASEAIELSTGSLTLVQADMRDLSLARGFDLVILGFNSLLLLGGKADRARALKTMRTHLTRDGRAVVDVWLPTEDDLALYDGRLVTGWTRDDPDSGEQVVKSWSATYDPDSQSAAIETHFEARPRNGAGPTHVTTRRDKVRFVTADDLLSEMAAAGLQPQHIAGGYDMSDFAADSERLIVVAARTAARTAGSRRRRPNPTGLV